MEDADKSKAIKTACAVALIVAACVFAVNRTRALQPSAKINNGSTDDSMNGTAEEFKQTAHTAAVEAGVSPDQLKKLDAINDQIATLRENQTTGTWEKQRELMDQAREITTPEQQKDIMQKIGDQMRADRQKRDKITKAILSKDDYKRYDEKRRERWGGGGGGRGGRGPGGNSGGGQGAPGNGGGANPGGGQSSPGGPAPR